MTMTRELIDETIRKLFAEVFTSSDTGTEAPDLKADTVLLDSGLDSLGFAILVTRLEEDLGYDPFSVADSAYYPTTYSEFLEFYVDHRPQ